MSALNSAVEQAARCLQQGGVIAYPTEAVWGLGCDPDNREALDRLLALKQRAPAKGVILVAASIAQVEPYLTAISAEQRRQLEQSWPGPNTWLIPDNGRAPVLVRGQHDSVALRVTAHPLVQALCRAFGGPVVSTSANPSNEPPALSEQQIRAYFDDRLDFILSGELGGQQQPSTIRDLRTGNVLRG